MNEQASPPLLDVHTVGADLLRALLDEVRLMPKPWAALPADEQAEVIDRLRNRVTMHVTDVVNRIAAGGRVAVVADLVSIAMRKGLRITLDADKNAAGKHDLIDALGMPVTLILGLAPQDYTIGMGDIKPEPDQARLDLEQASDDAIRRAKETWDDLEAKHRKKPDEGIEP